jgi:hypothetical protein
MYRHIVSLATSHGASMSRSIVARVAPNRIGPRPWPARIARIGPLGTGKVCVTRGRALADGAWPALAELDAAAPSDAFERRQFAESKTRTSVVDQRPNAFLWEIMGVL